MNLCNFSKNKLAQIGQQVFTFEREIQKIIEARLNELFFLQFVSLEFHIENFRLDTFNIMKNKKLNSHQNLENNHNG